MNANEIKKGVADARAALIEAGYCGPGRHGPGDDEVNALDALIAENEVLRNALKPFAAEARTWADTVPDKYRPGVVEPKQKFAYGKAKFNLGHLRAAAKILAQ